jgi:TorA maturation chaperone TorD
MTALWDTAHLRRDLYSFAAHLFAAEVTSSLYRRLTSGAFEPTADARTLVFVEPELRALDEDRAVEELAIDYCRLFVGPRAMCPPYASVYRGEALLGGRAEARLDAFMREHGLGVSGQAARIASEDHAAIQLAVLSSLYERVVEVRGRTDQRDILSFAKISSTRLTTADARVTRQGNARRRWTVESEEGNQILGHTDLRPYRSQAIQISGPIRPSRKEVKIRGSALTEGRARA